MNPPLLSLSNISKSFGKVCVLNSITFEACGGEIVALVGENGAGKSTLMKIISGIWPEGSFSGNILLAGQPTHYSSPTDAQNKGISIIHQELNLINELSIAENIFLGREPHRWGIIQWDELFKEAEYFLQELGITLSPKTPVKKLSIGQQQLIEIAKALSLKSKILILDEPTSALTEGETQKLFHILRQLKRKGTLSLYISHKLSEVLNISDRIYILRDGNLVSQTQTSEANIDQIISDMVGRKISDIFPTREAHLGKSVLEVKNLSCKNSAGETILHPLSFDVREGEILGIAGLMGSGRSLLLTTLFGAAPFLRAGEMRLCGKTFSPTSPRHAIAQGLALLTEDRKLSGILPDRGIKENMTLASLNQFSSKRIVNSIKEKNAVCELIEQFKIKAPHPETEVKKLSGGNQQKVLLARWFLTKPKVVFLDEPTRGVDVGAKTEIYQLIHQLAEQGTAIILVSSDLQEVLKMSDRIAVLNQGCCKDILDKRSATPEKIMRLATC